MKNKKKFIFLELFFEKSFLLKKYEVHEINLEK